MAGCGELVLGVTADLQLRCCDGLVLAHRQTGARCPGRRPLSALMRPRRVLARLAVRRCDAAHRSQTIGASLALSAPPAIPESIWGRAILLATRIAVSKPVPRACCTS